MADFWSQNIEPNRKNRWVLEFSNDAGKIGVLVYALKKCQAPSYKINKITHKFANHNFYYPGRVEWNTIPITFASVTENDATKLIYDVLGAGGYLDPRAIFVSNNTATYSFLEKNRYSNALSPQGVILKQLKADGTTSNKWTINKPFFTDLKFGTLDYNSEEIVDIECTMRFDWAQLDGASA
jgi:hypothetical protein